MLSRAQTAASGHLAWDPSSPERSPESEAYIAEHGYGYAPCMDDGSCDYGSGSIKDEWGAETFDGSDWYDNEQAYDMYYDNLYNDERSSYYEEEHWYAYPQQSYGIQTGRYVADGLAQVPLVLANAFSPQTQTSYTTYTTYSQPVEQVSYTTAPGYAQPTPLSVAVPSPQVQYAPSFFYDYRPTAPVSYETPIAQPVHTSAAQITGSYTIAAVQPTALPQQITYPQVTQASFFAAAEQKPIVRAEQIVVARTPVGTIGIDTAAEKKGPTCTVRAQPATIASGATTTLSWKANGATNARLSLFGDVALEGSKVLVVSSTTVFTLTVSGTAGTSTCTAKVAIDPSMCIPGCPAGYVCTPVAGTASSSSSPTSEKKSFWDWFW